jgi:hypothetical protein
VSRATHAGALAIAFLAVAACGTSGGATFDGGLDGTKSHDSGQDSMMLHFADGAACVNLQCSQSPDTSISGVVYDPAGKVRLYDVFVYVPNTTPDPIAPGNPTCTPCQAPASGSPIASAVTDTTGKFVITNAPSGDNIPLVMQVGKWRRQIVIPHVAPHVDNPQTDPNQTRLPGKSSEGDMPLIALTTGACDLLECWLERIGIDPSEFVTPTSTAGHVHIYTGYGGSEIAGGYTQPETYEWWMNASNLGAYDILLEGCDCSPHERNVKGKPGDAYSAFQTYLDTGGRAFVTHFYYNWFSPETACESKDTCQGPVVFNDEAKWCAGSCGKGTSGVSSYYVDTTFPKGMAFSEWLQNEGVTTTPGVISLDESQTDLNNDVGLVTGATRWIYEGTSATDPNYLTKYLTFNTPVGTPVAKQCGRAEFTEFHLGDFSSGAEFPKECKNQEDAGKHSNNQAALEFLFFDLSSCVQNDMGPPVQPPQ